LSEITPRWLSLDDAAHYCSVSKRMMFTWIASGKISANKVARHWLVDRLSIDAFFLTPDKSVHLVTLAMLEASRDREILNRRKQKRGGMPCNKNATKKI
jgi:excisionase family DNA binding protein